MENKSDIPVSVIVAPFNAGAFIDECFMHYIDLQEQSDKMEFIVFDVDSHDDTREKLKRYERIPRFRVIYHDENIGFARANNAASKFAKGEFLLLLNPDTISRPSDVLSMYRFMEAHPDVGMLGPCMTYEDGDAQESFGPAISFSSEVFGKIFNSPYFLNIFSFLKKIQNERLKKDEPQDVAWVSGACLMIRRELWEKIGGIDDHFFFSAVDMADLGIRVKKEGLRVVYYPAVTIIHKGGRSAATNRNQALLKSYEGTLYYFKKHKGVLYAFCARLAYICISLLKGCIAWLFSLVKGDRLLRDIARSHFKGAWQLLSGKI